MLEKVISIPNTLKMQKRAGFKNLHPTSIMSTEHIFSLFVFGETFPKPTDVNEEKVKYNAVTYLEIIMSHKL